MKDNRRGFLKTLGKLGVALGITTAACSAHHSHHPHHPKHPKDDIPVSKELLLDQIQTLKAHSRATPKAKIDLASNSHTVAPRPEGAFEFGFSGFKTDPMAADKIRQLNDDANLLYNSILDNESRAINPPMVVPPHVYDYITKRHVMDNLDAYNWGMVFDVKWVSWHSTDARFATKRAYWEARVKRPYRGIFKESFYRQSVELPMQYLITRVDDVNPVKEHAKRNAYEDLVASLREAITVVIATDKRMNPTAPKADNKQSSFDLLSPAARKTITK